MSELKDFPTQEEYDGDPVYFRDFERRLEISRQELLEPIYVAAGMRNENLLRKKLLAIGFYQADLKNACLTGKYPRWQKVEMFDMAVMYHDVLVEIDRILREEFMESGK